MGKIVTLALLAILLALAAGGSTVGCGGGGEQPDSAGGSCAAAMRLLQRLTIYYHFVTSAAPEILLADIPSDLRADIAVPQDAEVVGSLVYPLGFEYAEILLEVPLGVEEVLAFYRERLAEAGWHERRSSYAQGGFQPTLPTWTLFCRGECGDPSLTVVLYWLEDADATLVGLTLDANWQAPMCCDGVARPPKILPDFTDPDGTADRRYRGTSSGGALVSGAVVETQLDPEQIQAHYRQQLEEVGWRPGSQFSDAALAWGSWSYTDDSGGEWLGLLMIRAVSEGTWDNSFIATKVVPAN